MNDRHRCELCFVARIIYLLIIGGVSTRFRSDYEEMQKIAYKSISEPLIGLPARESGKIRRRVFRMEEKTINLMAGKSHGKDLAITVYFFINHLVEDGWIIIPEDSDIGKLGDFILSLIDPEDEDTKIKMISAREKAAEWIAKLQSEGYYK